MYVPRDGKGCRSLAQVMKWEVGGLSPQFCFLRDVSLEQALNLRGCFTTCKASKTTALTSHLPTGTAVSGSPRVMTIESYPISPKAASRCQACLILTIYVGTVCIHLDPVLQEGEARFPAEKRGGARLLAPPLPSLFLQTD